MTSRIPTLALILAVAGCDIAPPPEAETEQAIVPLPRLCDFSQLGGAPYYISPCTSGTGEVARYTASNGVKYWCDHETRPVVGRNPCIGFASGRVITESCDLCVLSYQDSPWKHGLLGTWTWNGGGYPIPSDAALLANPSAYAANQQCVQGPDGVVCSYLWTTAYWTLSANARYTLSYNNTTKFINGNVVTTRISNPASAGTETEQVHTAPSGDKWGEIYLKDATTLVVSGYTFLYPFVPPFQSGAYTLQVYDLNGVPYRNYVR